jgi:ABC-type cobalamin/Fe3+-siderophores transport system ATPase subunit
MLISYKLGQTSIVLRVKILDSSVSTGAGKTGLSSSSSGLIISTIADNEATATVYAQASSNIESITTLGTYAAPTSSKCRFKEVDSTNHKGVYEIQIADARFAVSSAKSLLISISGAANAAECDALIPLVSDDPYVAKPTNSSLLSIDSNGRIDVIKIAGTTQTARDIGASVLLSSGSGTGQLDFTSGVVKANVTQFGGSNGTFSSGRPEVNTTHLAGTSQTARDIGASVLLSSGTGTGQLDFSSGVVKSNLAQILGTALTETAGQIAAAFKKFFNIASPAATMDHLILVDTATDVTTKTGYALTSAYDPAKTAAQAGDVMKVSSGTGANQVDLSSGRVKIVDATIARATFAADTGLQAIRSNTAAAGANGSITLDASASATDDFYKGSWIYLTGGTGAGQARLCTAYVGSTQVASIAPNWATNPDNTTTFAILPAGGVDVELWRASVPNALISGRPDVNAQVVGDKTGYALTSAYDPAKTAAQAGDVMKVSSGTGANQISLSSGAVTVGTNNDKTGYGLSSAAVQAIWDALTSALTTAGSIGKWIVDKLDVIVSTRLATSGYTAPPTVGAIADQVWEETLADHSATSGSTAAALNAAGSAGDPWSTALPGGYGTGTAGKIIGDNVNATISSRSSHSAADVWTVGTRTLTSFGTLIQDIWDKATSALTTAGSIGKLLVDNINATISSRSTYAGTDTAGTTTLLSRIASALTITAGKVDVNDKTGFALTSAYDAAKTAAQAGDQMNLADNAITAAKIQSAAITAAKFASGALDAVWSTGTRTLTSFGTLIQDIWDKATSALTAAGSIGKLLVDNINATISSRSTYAGTDTAGTTTLLSRIASALTITSGKVDVNDKTGFALTSAYDAAKTAAQEGDDMNAAEIAGSSAAAENLRDSASVIYKGAVAGAATATTLIDSGLTQSDEDFWKGRIVIFLTGNLKFQATDITGFDPSTDQLTFTALTQAPSDGDQYVIL